LRNFRGRSPSLRRTRSPLTQSPEGREG
jgi:hypothetical protein